MRVKQKYPEDKGVIRVRFLLHKFYNYSQQIASLSKIGDNWPLEGFTGEMHLPSP